MFELVFVFLSWVIKFGWDLSSFLGVDIGPTTEDHSSQKVWNHQLFDRGKFPECINVFYISSLRPFGPQHRDDFTWLLWIMKIGSRTRSLRKGYPQK